MVHPDSSSPDSKLRSPTWQQAYEAVLQEADNQALFKRIEIAEASILSRQDDLMNSSDHHVERKAIENALADLSRLKKIRLNWR